MSSPGSGGPWHDRSPGRGRRVSNATSGSTATLAVAGQLDATTGVDLLDALRSALAARPHRVDIDLGSVTSFTDAGAAALGRCRALAARLPDGLHYRTEGGAGQQALLAAFDHESG